MADITQPLFTVYNNHIPDSGSPPSINGNDPDKYIGYFQNMHGEQFLFIYDRVAREGIIRHGDAGWNNPYPVVDGTAPRLIMHEAELLWLQACWSAATAHERPR